MMNSTAIAVTSTYPRSSGNHPKTTH
jgi:hypothetical protein